MDRYDYDYDEDDFDLDAWFDEDDDFPEYLEYEDLPWGHSAFDDTQYGEDLWNEW